MIITLVHQINTVTGKYRHILIVNELMAHDRVTKGTSSDIERAAFNLSLAIFNICK